MKNPYAKQIPCAKAKTDAYAVYGNDPRLPGWTWYILKMWQTPENAAKNPYARAFCCVTSPYTFGDGDFGDTYLSDIGGELIRGTDLRGEWHRQQNLKGGVRL